MPVPKKRIPKWAYVEESQDVDINYCSLYDVVEMFGEFPGSATLVVTDYTGYPEVRVEWRRVMTDDEYDKEYVKRKAQREKERAAKAKQEAEHYASVKAEAERLGLIDVE